MKTIFLKLSALRAVGLVLASLGLLVSLMYLQVQADAAASVVEADATPKLPEGIVVASAQSSWQAVFSSKY